MKRVIVFFSLALALSWGYWLTVIGSQQGWLAAKVPLTPFGAFGPAIAAITTAAWIDGRAGLNSLFRGFTTKAVPWQALGIAGFAWPAIVLTAILVAAGLCEPLTPMGGLPLVRLFAMTVEVFLFTAVAEELGWRGYLLPQLLARARPVPAALGTGVAWALWHLPLFYVHGTAQPGIPFSLFTVNVLMASLVYTGVYLLSRPSILPVLVLHTMQDVSLGLAPVLWPTAGASASFWYGYLLVVMLVGVAVAGWLIGWPRRATEGVT